MAPRQQQPDESRRCRASQRSEAERQNPRDQKTTAAETVSRCASQQEEGAQWKKVGVDDPLQADGVGVKASADRRQPDIDDRTVDETQARCQDRRRDDEAGIAGRMCIVDNPRAVGWNVKGAVHVPPM